MADTNVGSSTKSIPEIRIVGLNTDKTRRTLGSTTVYQVYFELSDNPTSQWRDIFGREWRNLNTVKEAGIDGRFLVLHCLLPEIAATHLPALKNAVAATNAAYRQYVRDQITEETRQANVWQEERQIVQDIARSLHFD